MTYELSETRAECHVRVVSFLYISHSFGLRRSEQRHLQQIAIGNEGHIPYSPGTNFVYIRRKCIVQFFATDNN